MHARSWQSQSMMGGRRNAGERAKVVVEERREEEEDPCVLSMCHRDIRAATE